MNNFNPEIYNQRSANRSDYTSVQAWKTPKAATPDIPAQSTQTHIINNLEKANLGKIGHFDIELRTATAYAQTAPPTPENKPNNTADRQFKFRDIVDIVNPLQHIPIVNMAYRSFTDDEIHPLSQIIGGAVYGGPIGAVTGTANAITKMKTGLDIGDHAMQMAGLERTPTVANTPISQTKTITNRIENAQFINQIPDMALGFANFSEPRAAIKQYEHAQMAQGRTAGQSTIERALSPDKVAYQPDVILQDIDNLPPKENITSLKLSEMPRERLI